MVFQDRSEIPPHPGAIPELRDILPSAKMHLLPPTGLQICYQVRKYTSFTENIPISHESIQSSVLFHLIEQFSRLHGK